MQWWQSLLSCTNKRNNCTRSVSAAEDLSHFLVWVSKVLSFLPSFLPLGRYSLIEEPRIELGSFLVNQGSLPNPSLGSINLNWFPPQPCELLYKECWAIRCEQGRIFRCIFQMVVDNLLHTLLRTKVRSKSCAWLIAVCMTERHPTVL